MDTMIKQAVDHWHYVAPLLSKPENEDDFNTHVEALREWSGCFTFLMEQHGLGQSD